MLWEQKGNMVWVFGRRAPPSDVVTAVLGALQPMVEVVSTKHFCHDLQCGGMVNAAWVGLLREAEGTCASASGVMVMWQGPCASNALLCLHCCMSLMMCSKHPQSHLQHVLNTELI